MESTFHMAKGRAGQGVVGDSGDRRLAGRFSLHRSGHTDTSVKRGFDLTVEI
jgi:hypothetical protein|tara:strand:- start:9642 stop:9797 length:156 start_codon:yes stop_codon:yes gene_type:complete